MSDEHDGDLSRLVRAYATRHRASPAQESALRTEITLESAARRRETPRSRVRHSAWQWMGVGFAFGVLLSLVALFALHGVGEADQRDAELVASHVRGLMVAHLTDVPSSDQHTVKPWFQGKLSYSPVVKDLSAEGFPLLGGRLDFVSDRPVAAIVYRRNGHLIDVFQWPEGGGGGPEVARREGFHIVRWKADGMRFAAVSDLNEEELRQLSRLLP
jgi:anti-sigma factor RsiW